MRTMVASCLPALWLLVATVGCGRVGFAGALLSDGAVDSAVPEDTGPDTAADSSADVGDSEPDVSVDTGPSHCATAPDADGDGFDDAACPGGDDCDDTNPAINPAAIEAPGFDGRCYDRRDNDCDGLIDGDVPSCPTPLFRSVGTNGGDLNTVAATFELSSGLATFDADLPLDVGVGDVVQYENAGATTASFVQERVTDRKLRLRDEIGAVPANTVAGTAARIHRAYTSLVRWQALDANDSLDDTVEGFGGSRDLVAAEASIHVALYDDGVDVGNVVVTGWVTSPTSFIRFFTPVDERDAGTSQRHRGRYGAGYRFEAAADADALAVLASHVRFEGVSAKSFFGATLKAAISVVADAPDIDVRMDACIGHGNQTTSTNGVIHMEARGATAAGSFYEANNIAFDAPTGSSECMWHRNTSGADARFYVYNNTVYDCVRGIEAREMRGRLIARNNISITTGADAFYDYDGVGDGFSPLSSGNVSSDDTAAAIGSAILTGADPATLFESLVAGAEDFHLRADATSVLGRADDLASDPDFPVSRDVDGDNRPLSGGWDPGADER